MLNSLEESFMYEDMKLFREFDVTNFISNTKATFGNKMERIDVPIKINHYSNMLDKAIRSLSEVDVDKKIVNNLNGYGKSILIIADDLGFKVRDLSSSPITLVNDNALRGLKKKIQKDLNDVIGGANPGVIVNKYRFNTSLLDDFKKTAFAIAEDMDTKKWNTNTILYKPLSGNYIVKELIPFVNEYSGKKNIDIISAKHIIEDINDMAKEIKISLDALDRMKREGTISPEKVPFLNMAIYNITRTMLEAMSFMSFAMIRKINLLVTNAMDANMTYVRLVDAMNVKENAFDDSIMPLDTQSLGDEFINGEAGAFIDTSNNIYQFHMGNLYNMIHEENLSNVMDYEVAQEAYDNTIYTDVNEIFTQVAAGLDKIGAKTDDVFMVTDDIVNAAGFDLKLYDRFANTIDRIDDVSLYQGSANLSSFGPTDKVMMKRILSEIKDYGNNLSEIAKNCASTKRKLVMLQERFNDNINGEFQNVDTVMDLKILLDDLLEQYEDIVRSIVKKFILRLKLLGDILTEVAIAGEEQKSDFTIDDTDTTVNYSEMAFDSIIKDEELLIESEFESLNKLFFYAKESHLSGFDITFEAEGAPNTTPTVVDNSGVQSAPNNNGGNGIASVSGKISEFINNMITRFTEFVDKQGKKNIRWLAENKEELSRRSYNNVTVNILPYENIKPEKILKDIDSLKNNLTGLQVTQLSSINNENDVYRVLFPFIEGGVSDQGSAKDQIEKYYKVGRGDLTPKPVANGQLKTTVVSTMIPYCENYYGQLKNQLSDALRDCASAADNAIGKLKTSTQEANQANKPATNSQPVQANNAQPVGSTPVSGNTTGQPGVVTASTDDIVTMMDAFLEADNPQAGGTNSKVSTWISKAVKTYSGCVLNACRDRANDYMKVLDILVPKTTNSVNKGGSPIETTSNQQNAQPVGTQPIQ